MYIDIIAGIILVLGILTGLKKGFFFEVLSFFILILNIVLAKQWTPNVFEYVQNKININDNVLYFFTYLAILAGLYVATSMILSILKRSLPKMFMGVIDAILGGILGGVKGTFIVIVILIFINLLSTMVDGVEKYTNDSQVNEFFLDNMNKLEGYYPDGVAKKLEEFELKKMIEEEMKKHMSK